VAYEVRDGVFTYYRNGTASYISAKNIKYISGNYCEPHMKFLDRIDLARKLLRADADLSVKDAEGWTALPYIARLQLDMIREFIKRGADVYDRTPDGRGVLHLMAMEPQRSEKDAVGALASAVKKAHKLKSLQADAQLLDALHAADDHGWTPLHYLAWRTDAREVLQPFAAFDVAANPRRKQVTGAAYRDVSAGTTAEDIAVGRGLDGTSYKAY
jgi:ankyrin repeat protein